MRFATVPLIVSFGLVASCVQPVHAPQAAPTPRLPVAPPAAAPVPAAPVDAVSPGIWTYETDARGTRALFGLAHTDALFVIRCDRTARRIIVSVAGSDPGAMTLRATTMVREFTARTTGTTPAYLAVEIVPSDGILDALAFSRGRFTVTLGPRALMLPVWPEFSRVVEDCRS